MDFLATPFGVFLILAVVAAAAFMYTPTKYAGVWLEVAERYETDRRPKAVTFRDEDIALGLFEVTTVDVAADDEGLWMLYTGTAERHAPACTLIPWDCVRFKEDKGTRQVFQIRLNGPVDFLVSPELGEVLKRRAGTMPPGVS